MDNRFERIKAHLESQRLHLTEELKLKVSQSVVERREGNPFGKIEEAATESFELEKRVALAKCMKEQLAEVEYALKKLEKGTYELCDSCGKPIPLARLEAIPEANLCLACKSLQDKRKLSRPVALQVHTLSPLARR